MLGEVLRRARQARGLTLHEVQRKSKGRFKPSTLGGYERGERIISLRRFCDLAALYGAPADRLLAELLSELNPQTRRPLVLQPERFVRLDDEVRRPLSEFIKQVTTARGDHAAKVVTLRSGDLETLSTDSGLAPRTLLDRLSPALRG